MIKIIVTGHGEFSAGMMSALKLIAGEVPQVVSVNFLESDSTELLNERLKSEMTGQEKEILVLSDLLGGSPFKEAVLLKAAFPEKNIEVLSGVNFPMLLTAALVSSDSASELAEMLLVEGQVAITRFKKREVKTQVIEEGEEEGI